MTQTVVDICKYPFKIPSILKQAYVFNMYAPIYNFKNIAIILHICVVDSEILI